MTKNESNETYTLVLWIDEDGLVTQCLLPDSRITPRVRKALRAVDQKKPFAEYNVGVLKRADALNAAIVAMVAKGYYGDLNDFIDAEIWAELEKLRSELSHVAGRDAFGAYANTKSSSKLRIERYARPKLPATISHVVTVGSG